MKSKFTISNIGNRIFKLQMLDGVEITMKDAQKMSVEFRKLAKGKKFAVLLDASNNFTLRKEAMDYLSSNELTLDRIAAAFVTKSIANKLVGNFFIKVKRPSSPTKMFSDEKDAIEWLLGFMDTKSV